MKRSAKIAEARRRSSVLHAAAPRASPSIMTRLTERHVEIEGVLRRALADTEALRSLAESSSSTLSTDAIDRAIDDLAACTDALAIAAAASGRLRRITSVVNRDEAIAELFNRHRTSAGSRDRLNTPLFPSTPLAMRRRHPQGFTSGGLFEEEVEALIKLQQPPTAPNSSAMSFDRAWAATEAEVEQRIIAIESALSAWKAECRAVQARANPQFRARNDAAAGEGTLDALRAHGLERASGGRRRTLKIVRPLARSVRSARRKIERLRAHGSAPFVGEARPSAGRGSKGQRMPRFDLRGRLAAVLEYGRSRIEAAWDDADAAETTGEGSGGTSGTPARVSRARLALEEAVLSPFLDALLEDCAACCAGEDHAFGEQSRAIHAEGMDSLLARLDVARLFRVPAVRTGSGGGGGGTGGGAGGVVRTLGWKLNAVVISLAAAELRQLCRAALPVDKARACVGAVCTVSQALSLASRSAASGLAKVGRERARRAVAALRHDAAAAASTTAASPHGSFELSPIGSDELLPCMIVVVVEAGLARPLAHLSLIEAWRDPNAMQSEEGFCVATILTAVHYVVGAVFDEEERR